MAHDERKLEKQRERERQARGWSNREIAKYIAKEGDPPGSCFLVNGAVCIWSRYNGIMMDLIDDEVWNHALTRYLSRHGLAFESFEAAEEYARNNNWPREERNNASGSENAETAGT